MLKLVGGKVRGWLEECCEEARGEGGSGKARKRCAERVGESWEGKVEAWGEGIAGGGVVSRVEGVEVAEFCGVRGAGCGLVGVCVVADGAEAAAEDGGWVVGGKGFGAWEIGVIDVGEES